MRGFQEKSTESRRHSRYFQEFGVFRKPLNTVTYAGYAAAYADKKRRRPTEIQVSLQGSAFAAFDIISYSFLFGKPSARVFMASILQISDPPEMHYAAVTLIFRSLYFPSFSFTVAVPVAMAWIELVLSRASCAVNA